MKKFLLIIISLVTLISGKEVLSQEYIEFTGVPSKNKRIALIPFDPYIYTNDATSIIAKKENETHDQIMHYFRSQLNHQLYNAMMDSCIVVDLLGSNMHEANDYIIDLYSSVKYTLGLAMQNRPEDNEDISKKKNKKEKKEEQVKLEEMKNAKTRIERGELVGGKMSMDDKYLHIYFTRPETLHNMAEILDVEYFLFINQFEIRGDYRDPYISGNQNAKRILKVHFSLYDSECNIVHGGFGENNIPFYLDDKKEIVNLYFPEVIRQIIRNIDF